MAQQASATDFLQAIVMLRTRIPAGARTAEALGRERQGSAVVIDANGLLVTIGYLLLEAEHAEIVTHEGDVVPVERKDLWEAPVP